MKHSYSLLFLLALSGNYLLSVHPIEVRHGIKIGNKLEKTLHTLNEALILLPECDDLLSAYSKIKRQFEKNHNTLTTMISSLEKSETNSEQKKRLQKTQELLNASLEQINKNEKNRNNLIIVGKVIEKILGINNDGD